MRRDFGNRVALIASSAIYAVAHLVRSPAHYYLTGYHPAAGLETLAHSVDQFADPAIAIPTLIGLFLLGIVLGEAYILNGQCVFLDRTALRASCWARRLWPKLIAQRRRRDPVMDSGAPVAVPLIGGAGRMGRSRSALLSDASPDHPGVQRTCSPADAKPASMQRSSSGRINRRRCRAGRRAVAPMRPQQLLGIVPHHVFDRLNEARAYSTSDVGVGVAGALNRDLVHGFRSRG